MTEPLLIVVPMAGRGSRFANVGYKDPKPLIPVNGVPMIRLVIENLKPSTPHRFVFICQHAHVSDYGLAPLFAAWAPGSSIVELDGITEGAACTALAAKEHITDAPLMIANSDQYIDASIDDYLAAQGSLDGLIMTMTASDPKWSFAALDGHGHVTRVAEKEPISSEATVGIYNFRRGSEFVAAAEHMIAQDKRVNGEFYVAPVYNEMIENGAKIGVFNIGTDVSGMYGLGTPADLEHFLSLPLSERVTKAVG